MDLEFDELRREFLAEAEVKAREISETMKNQNPPSREAVERMVYLAHQLKGAGGSYGYEVISTEAAAIETALEKAVTDTTAEELENIGKRIERLQSVIRQRADEFSTRPASQPR